MTKEDSAFGPGMMFGIPGPGPKPDRKPIPSDPKKKKGKYLKTMKTHIPTYEQFLDEGTLRDDSMKVPISDVGYQMIFVAIEKYLQKPMAEIEEVESVEDFVSGEIKTFSTVIEGNFVLDCGFSNGKSICKLLDELNDEIKFYA